MRPRSSCVSTHLSWITRLRSCCDFSCREDAELLEAEHPAGGLEPALENITPWVESHSRAAGRRGARSGTGISVPGRRCCWCSAPQAAYGAWEVSKRIFFRSRSFCTFLSAFTPLSLLTFPCWLRAMGLGRSQLGSGRGFFWAWWEPAEPQRCLWERQMVDKRGSWGKEESPRMQFWAGCCGTSQHQAGWES